MNILNTLKHNAAGFIAQLSAMLIIVIIACNLPSLISYKNYLVDYHMPDRIPSVYVVDGSLPAVIERNVQYYSCVSRDYFRNIIDNDWNMDETSCTYPEYTGEIAYSIN